MGHSSRSMEGNASGDLICGCLAQEVSQRKNISMYPRDHSCNILPKINVVSFYTSHKNMCEAKLKSFLLMVLLEKILRQPRIG